MEALIKSSEVEEIFTNCLFEEKEVINGVPTIPPVVVKGITMKIGFNIFKLEKNRERIISILDNLPQEFKEDIGLKFNSMCFDKNNTLWTGLHLMAEQLLFLGLAIGELRYTLENNFVGGLPYVKRIENNTFRPDLVRYRVNFTLNNKHLDFINLEATTPINFFILMNEELSKRFAKWDFIEPIRPKDFLK